MDWNAAVDKNLEALKRILATLVGMAEVGSRGQFASFPHKGADVARRALAEKSRPSPAPTLPRRLHRYVLSLLRPAEAAVRRLIIVAARGLVLPPPHPRKPAMPRKPGRPGRLPQNPAPPALPLFDPLRPWNRRSRPAPRGMPRISVPGYSEPARLPPPASPDDPLDATRLAARLQALAAALDDLPGQARRFARWRDRAKRPQNPPPPCGEGPGVGVPCRRPSPASSMKTRARRIGPLKPGWPPGWRRKPAHEVHDVLDVVHGLARWVLAAPDTS